MEGGFQIQKLDIGLNSIVSSRSEISLTVSAFWDRLRNDEDL